MVIVKQKAKGITDRYATDTGIIPVKKILILAANPKTTSRLRLDEEVREIEDGLQRAKTRERFVIHQRWAVRLRDLRRALLDIEPQIVHFAGHGKKNGLVVEDEVGGTVLISAKALSGLFALCADHVECVILSACFSAPQAAAINQHIDHVIGMRKEIKDKAAIEFTVGFYDALGAGKPVEHAFKFGCNAIHQMFPDIPEHLIPVLKTKKGLKKQDRGERTNTERKKEMVDIRVRLETTGDSFDVRVSLNDRTSAVKNLLIRELKLPEVFEDGQPVTYYLLSKARSETMADEKTLRENGVQEGEIFVFLVEAYD